ncbi:MAG: hypothetical protein U1E76_01890 [Planctomycetota bacterium]
MLACSGGELVEQHELRGVEPALFAAGTRPPATVPARGALLQGSALLSQQVLIEAALRAALPGEIVDRLEPLRDTWAGDLRRRRSRRCVAPSSRASCSGWD